MRDFRKLLVWRRAHALHIAIDVAARVVRRRAFANLKSQLTRAAESIPGNIVEGAGAATQREFARYLDIAIKSATETEYHLFAAADRGALPAAAANPLMAETVEVRRMLFGLRNRVLADERSEPPVPHPKENGELQAPRPLEDVELQAPRPLEDAAADSPARDSEL